MNLLFSAPNKEEACGLFTVPHLVGLLVCAILITLAVIFTRKISDKGLTIVTRVMAVMFTVMEIIKIVFKFVNNDATQLDHWFPLAFCSLFIYVLWFCGFGKGFIYDLGASFIAGGCFIGGSAFLIMPLTSLQYHPIYHFLSLHSMLFHSCMVYMAIMYVMKGKFKVNTENYKYYLTITGFACVVSVGLNLITDALPMTVTSNVMLLRHLPLPDTFNQFVYNLVGNISAPFSYYTVITTLVYTVLPYFAVMGVCKLISKIKGNKKS
ncbi:MAG: YwaF family protein [Clostridia bacterium]|nr:YwaF family protein [Clostridia bacterium]